MDFNEAAAIIADKGVERVQFDALIEVGAAIHAELNKRLGGVPDMHDRCAGYSYPSTRIEA